MPAPTSDSAPAVIPDLASAVIEPCPECRNGKHTECTKWSLDEQTDEVVGCPCHENGHPA